MLLVSIISSSLNADKMIWEPCQKSGFGKAGDADLGFRILSDGFRIQNSGYYKMLSSQVLERLTR